MQNSYSLVNNIIWTLRITFRYLPFITTLRIIGLINNYGNTLARTFILGIIINWIIEYSNNPVQNQQLITNSLFVFGIYLLINSLANIARSFADNQAGFLIERVIPTDLLQRKLQNLTVADLENPQVQNLINRYQENTYIIDLTTKNIFIVTVNLLLLVVAAIPILQLMPIVMLALFIASIPGFISNKHIFKKLWQLDVETTVENRRSGSIGHQLTTPSEFKEIKLIGAFEFLRERYLRFVNQYVNQKRNIYTKWAVLDLVNYALTGAAILFGIQQTITLVGIGTIDIGSATFYIGAIMSVGSLIDMIFSYGGDFLENSVRIADIRTLLEYPVENKEDKDKMSIDFNNLDIKLSNVSFTYPGADKPVIKNVNLHIKPGEKIAIVGENGAGKTTLVKLLSGVYPVSEGSITVNDIDLNKINPEDWFKHIGLLYQDYNTYSDLSVTDNISIGDSAMSIDPEEIISAAKKADAHEFVNTYPQKYDQILSERYEKGIRPSTGQWQKIAIARFFYRNAPILILDEPTASIDAVSESNIFNRIYEFIENKTVIIISHRFSTVRKADRIIVFDKGAIVEEGSHADLISQNGIYANAFALQAKGYQN